MWTISNTFKSFELFLNLVFNTHFPCGTDESTLLLGAGRNQTFYLLAKYIGLSVACRGHPNQ